MNKGDIIKFNENHKWCGCWSKKNMEEKVNIESFIEEMTKVRPEVLTPEAKSLFNMMTKM